jgi:hypothetical protein
MSKICPECGAVLSEEDTCQSIFESFLVLEFTDPGYGEVHFLTVACYMIQHGRYSDAGLVWIQGMLRAYLEGEMTNDQLRQLARKDTDNRDRTWKVNRAANAAPLPKIDWTMTIADVAEHYADPQSYQQAVRDWGRATLKQMNG